MTDTPKFDPDLPANVVVERNKRGDYFMTFSQDDRAFARLRLNGLDLKSFKKALIEMRERDVLDREIYFMGVQLYGRYRSVIDEERSS